MHLNKILVIREKKRTVINCFPVLITNRGRRKRKRKSIINQPRETIMIQNYLLLLIFGPVLCIVRKTRHQKLARGIENKIQTLTKIVRDATPPGVTFNLNAWRRVEQRAHAKARIDQRRVFNSVPCSHFSQFQAKFRCVVWEARWKQARAHRFQRVHHIIEPKCHTINTTVIIFRPALKPW